MQRIQENKYNCSGPFLKMRGYETKMLAHCVNVAEFVTSRAIPPLTKLNCNIRFCSCFSAQSGSVWYRTTCKDITFGCTAIVIIKRWRSLHACTSQILHKILNEQQTLAVFQHPCICASSIRRFHSIDFFASISRRISSYSAEDLASTPFLALWQCSVG